VRLRVVADTNVHISAFVFGGVCETLLALARADIFELFVSPAIPAKIEAVLGEDFAWNEQRIHDVMAEIDSLATLVRPTVAVSGVISGPDDERILECALASDADVLVTGDKRHLLPLKRFQGIAIVSPRQFLDSLR